MSITLEIPESLYQRLQKHAIPFVDTPISVIERLADHFEAKPSDPIRKTLPSTSISDRPHKKFNPLQPPDLFHTRSQGTFGSIAFSNWNDLVRIAHIETLAKTESFEELRTVTHAQIRKGSHSDSGYHYVPEIGISLQGVDANHAWRHALRLAQYLKTPLRAQVEWRNNEKAAYPGTSGVLEWNP
jgi:hypothetical protein